MELFRNLPFRVLAAGVLALGVGDLAVITTSGGNAPPKAQHLVAMSSESRFDDIRAAKQAASRSQFRTTLHPQRHPHFPQVTCWNGEVVVDHPRVQDCPDRPVVTASASAEAWAHTWMAIRVANCESGGTPQGDHYDGNPHVTSNPRYRGKWQMGFTEWASEGGTGDPALASEAEQDFRAWKLWEARGWEPWQCASLV